MDDLYSAMCLVEYGKIGPDVWSLWSDLAHYGYRPDRMDEADAMPMDDLAAYMEGELIKFRSTASLDDRIAISVRSAMDINWFVTSFAESQFHYKVPVERLGDSHQVAPLRRSINRIKADFREAGPQRVRDLIRASELRERRQLERNIALDNQSPEVAKERKKVAKRSVKFLERFVPQEDVRAYVSGNGFRVEGKNCIYEFVNKYKGVSYGDPMPFHGNLLLLNKDDPSIVLGDICIVTHGVPVLDHIASLVVAIRAGDEDRILQTGNISMSRGVETPEWLSPYMPYISSIPVVIPPVVTGARSESVQRAMDNMVILPEDEQEECRLKLTAIFDQLPSYETMPESYREALWVAVGSPPRDARLLLAA